jgi:hypothetical protein
MYVVYVLLGSHTAAHAQQNAAESMLKFWHFTDADELKVS